MRLVMAGPLAPRPWDPHYFEREVRPHIASDRVIYLGERGPADLERVYRGAACALFPMEWEEPFSLAVVEAVVEALARGDDGGDGDTDCVAAHPSSSLMSTRSSRRPIRRSRDCA